MPRSKKYECAETIKQTLAQRMGSANDARAVAEATLGTWRQMAVRLEPVIGARGVDALFRRSLLLTSRTLPWLKLPENTRDNALLLDWLQMLLASLETKEAVASSCSLLANFTELLASLIGDSLAKHLLKQVWEPASPASEQETPS